MNALRELKSGIEGIEGFDPELDAWIEEQARRLAKPEASWVDEAWNTAVVGGGILAVFVLCWWGANHGYTPAVSVSAPTPQETVHKYGPPVTNVYNDYFGWRRETLYANEVSVPPLYAMTVDLPKEFAGAPATDYICVCSGSAETVCAVEGRHLFIQHMGTSTQEIYYTCVTMEPIEEKKK